MSHEYFLWMSYGVAAIVIATELVALRLGRARALRRIEEERDLETQD
ncbi:MAG TPA: heme exporter protein CcmD [Usitatibacter sp.]|jgi:heme exporter protein CcmD|nr:heme exporter protein CcmD [Usitatibacter sp.]